MKKTLLLLSIKLCLWRMALLWCTSLRIQKLNDEQFRCVRDEGRNYVVAFWHGSMLMGWYLHRPQKRNIVSALVSQSNDGEFLSAILEKWGYKMIRGSSNVGGKEAMQLMVNEVMLGNSLAITPDGPRGPIHEMKMGAVRTAQQARVPLFLIAIALKKKKVLQSWDKFEVPIPFSRVVIKYSEPINVPYDYTGVQLDEFKKNVEKKMFELSREAENIL